MESTKQKHKRWRTSFRTGVLSRDGHKCAFCSRTANLDAHHITDRHEMPNGGYSLSNGISLCKVHHPMAERWHATGTCEPGFCPDDLYRAIGSSKDRAYHDSLNLK